MKLIASLLFVALTAPAVYSQPFIVKDGQPRAQIVLPKAPTRTQRLAAHEFRAGIEKISGARLPIVTRPGTDAVKIFIGASNHHPIKADELQHGAYRLKTGKDWFALVGDDTEFKPTGPFAQHNGDIPRAQAEWEKIVGAPYGLPNPGAYKHRIKLPGEIGKPDGVPTGKNERFELWGLDERGSFNAVCGFLHKLGARWYLPGPIGEVMPSVRTIPLPQLDETVRPDFALRQFNFRFAVVGPETALWAMRLGIRNDEQVQIAHGMATMTNRPAVFAAHPEWFALYGGKRDFRPRDSKCQLCYSNDELFRETVRYARAQLDTFGFKTVSIMPPDGYTSICQCEKCKGKDSPDRHERGLLSDYVWDFVNRVAKEVGKTHPDAKVVNCAYGVYTLPPLKIEKLEPNVVVCIVGGRRPINKAGSKGEGEAAPEALRAAWAPKTDNPLLIFENYPFTDRGWYLPAFAAHALGDTVNATKGNSDGEDVWLTVRQDFDKVGIGFNHFLVYFTARMYWGGKGADVDATFREYCRLFYGTAEREMADFFDYCEANWSAMEEDQTKADTALAHFEKAKEKCDPAGVHAARLALIDDFLKGLRMKSIQLAQKRGPVPVLRLVGDARDLAIDGKLDDAYWQDIPTAATGRLRELQTGRTPLYTTSVKAGWEGSSLCFAIRCEERMGEKPNNTATRDDDQAIWHGDAVELEIATESHSYYSIAVSPSGAVVDLDRGAPPGQWFAWDAKAEVATQVADGHWTIEIRIPITQDENDPLHQVVGRKPTQSLPWHVNICRQRIRDDGAEYSALSPTGAATFHEPMKFAYFYAGKSHRFEADPTVTDFITASREGEKVRKPADALATWLRLSEGKVTPLQKSAALENAATAANTLRDFAQADAITARIPIEAVKKTVQMRSHIARYSAQKAAAEFAGEEIEKWPFWQRGAGYYVRGRVLAISKAGAEAERDLTAALNWTTQPRSRDAVLLELANNRETNLRDDARALEAYSAIVEGRQRIGSADEFSALQGIARILTRSHKYDEAIAALNRADLVKLTGTWRGNILLSVGDVHTAAGRQGDARAAFQAVVADATLEKRLHNAAAERLRQLR